MRKDKDDLEETAIALLILLSSTLARAGDVQKCEDVLRAMHDHYATSWYANLIFTQKSTTYNADATTKVRNLARGAGVAGQAAH